MENNLLMTGAKPESQGVSDVEVESVMKLLIAYQKARSEGVAPPNPDLEVHTLSLYNILKFEEN